MITTLEHLFSKYDLAETLGTGAFSEVKVAIEKTTGNRYAIKIIDKARCKGKEGMIDTEVNILLRVRHENIVQLYEMFEIENKIYLVMEIVTGGELFDEIVKRGKYTEVEASRITHKILGAVEYLHSIDIAHRDLKPENLLLSEKSADAKVMISDFGLSKILNDESAMKTACGTPGYVAPEVLKKRGYGKEVDLWSIGVIAYILLVGYPPFYDKNNAVLYRQIMAGKYEFDRPWWDNISDDAKDFIRKLLTLDPKLRMTARQALNHPFIVKTCGITQYGRPSPANTLSRGIAPQASIAASMRPSLIPVPVSSVNITTPALSNLPPSGIPIPSVRSSVSKSRFVVGNASEPKSNEDTTPTPLRIEVKPKNHKSPQTIESSFGAPSDNSQQEASQLQPIGDKKEVYDSGCVVEKKDEDVRASVQSDTTAIDDSSRPNSIASRAQTFSQVRILSYNIFLRPPGIANSDSDFKNARLTQFSCNVLPAYDIVCLQEIYSSGSTRMSKLLMQAKKYGFEYHVASPSKGILNTSVDGGLLILSRYPIVKTDKVTYKRGIHGDRYTAKGAIYAKIKVAPNKYIHVFNTHLQSSAKDAPLLVRESDLPAVTNTMGLQIPGANLFNPPASSPLFSRARTPSTDQSSNNVEANSAGVRLAQLAVLKEFIDEIMKANQGDAAFLAGTLNVNSRPTILKTPTKDAVSQSLHSEEYLTMLRLLRGELLVAGGFRQFVNGSPAAFISAPIRFQVKDIMYEKFGEHPITHGEMDGVTARSPSENPVSIDYVLLMIPKDIKSKSPKQDEYFDDSVGEENVAKMVDELTLGTNGISVEPKSTRIEKLPVEQEGYLHLSDHYGLATSVIVPSVV